MVTAPLPSMLDGAMNPEVTLVAITWPSAGSFAVEGRIRIQRAYWRSTRREWQRSPRNDGSK